MGIAIKNTNATYGRSLGNIYPDNQILLKQGIYDDAVRKAAFKKFYASFKEAGFLTKFDVFRLFYGGTARADKFNIINPEDTAEAHVGYFLNDSPDAHTISGFQPMMVNAQNASRIIKSNFKIPAGADLNNSHFHAFNTTSESNVTSENRYLLGASSTSNGNAVFIALNRNRGNRTSGVINTGFGSSQVGLGVGAYDITKKGLLSVFRVGSVTKLWDAGVQIASQSAAAAIVAADNTIEIWEGHLNGESSPLNVTAAKLGAIGYGIGKVWTDADEVALNGMLVTFFSDLGVTI